MTGRAPSGQALAVPAEPSSTVSALTGFDPSRIGTCLWCEKRDTPLDPEMLCDMCTNALPTGSEPDPLADAAEDLGRRYRRIQDDDYACSAIQCVYPHDGNCHCFNLALAEHVAERAASGTLTEGGDVEQAPSDSLSGPTAESRDAQ